MIAEIHDTSYFEAFLAQRAANKQDRWDEVWEGVYMMAPAPNNEHQDVVDWIIFVLKLHLRADGFRINSLRNVSDGRSDWTKNYRIPDVLVFSPSNDARDAGTHWVGGPDLAIEVLSDGDRARDKIDFYGRVGTREVLLIDRDPWRLELYRFRGGEMTTEVAMEVVTQSIGVKWRVLGEAELEMEFADGAGERF